MNDEITTSTMPRQTNEKPKIGVFAKTDHLLHPHNPTTGLRPERTRHGHQKPSWAKRCTIT